MSTSERSHALRATGLVLAFALSGGLSWGQAASTPTPGASPSGAARGIGRAITPAQLAAWDIDIDPDGRGLPAGRGSVRQGEKLFAERCAACHGPRGENGIADRLVGGQGSLATKTPVRTIGSFWPYATTLFDYIRRAMPFDRPQSLAPSEVYALSAFLLNLNGLLPADGELDARTLPQVRMPNRGGFFTSDEKPDVQGLLQNFQP